jgi:hypothetical protein
LKQQQQQQLLQQQQQEHLQQNTVRLFSNITEQLLQFQQQQQLQLISFLNVSVDKLLSKLDNLSKLIQISM